MREPHGHEIQVAYDSDSFRQQFNIGKTKLHEELNAGRLKARRLGRKILITHGDAMAWLNSLPQRDALAKGDCK